jgi:hypothetical protein
LPLQDARKGVLFDQLPPVLQLQLKRFEYDFARDTMVKVRPYVILSYILINPSLGATGAPNCSVGEQRLSNNH